MSLENEPRHDPRSLSTLLSDLVQQMTTLFRTETTLLKTELQENLQKVGNGAMEIAAGAILLLAALLVLLQALVVALANVMGAGWASLLVGVVVAIVGAILLRNGTKNVSPSGLAPDRTMGQLRQDANLAKEKAQ